MQPQGVNQLSGATFNEYRLIRMTIRNHLVLCIVARLDNSASILYVLDIDSGASVAIQQ